MPRFDVPAQTILVETQQRPAQGIRPGQLTRDGQRFIGEATMIINALQIKVAELEQRLEDGGL